MSDDCLICSERIRSTDESRETFLVKVDGTALRRRIHVECGLRDVLGGIGHHENHQYWCTEMHDPDGGRTRRQSALEVAAMWRDKGSAMIYEDPTHER